MLICKIGKSHLDSAINKQDAGYADEHYKFVADGCGSSPHSEVGAQLMAFSIGAHIRTGEALDLKIVSDEFFEQFDLDFIPKELHPEAVGFIRDYLLFTTILSKEKDEYFQVQYVGDGFVIEVHKDDSITFHELGVGEQFVDFYGYNYLPRERLSIHKEIITVNLLAYPKTMYKNIGVATDGLRFLFKMPEELRNEFVKLLIAGKELPVKLFINRNFSYFQDDITIAL